MPLVRKGQLVSLAHSQSRMWGVPLALPSLGATAHLGTVGVARARPSFPQIAQMYLRTHLLTIASRGVPWGLHGVCGVAGARRHRWASPIQWVFVALGASLSTVARRSMAWKQVAEQGRLGSHRVGLGDGPNERRASMYGGQ